MKKTESFLNSSNEPDEIDFHNYISGELDILDKMEDITRTLPGKQRECISSYIQMQRSFMMLWFTADSGLEEIFNKCEL